MILTRHCNDNDGDNDAMGEKMEMSQPLIPPIDYFGCFSIVARVMRVNPLYSSYAIG
jgi:hypothetical protein